MRTIVRYRMDIRGAIHTVPDDPVCNPHPHGHPWWVEIAVKTDPDRTGVLRDEADLRLWNLVVDLRYADLNVMLKGAYPTVAGVAGWLLERLRMPVPGLLSVTVGYEDHSVTVEV